MRPTAMRLVRQPVRMGLFVVLLACVFTRGVSAQRRFRGPEPVRTPAPASDLVSGDFDGDGRLDIALSLEEGGVALLLAAAGGGFSEAIDLAVPAGDVFLRAADFGGSPLLDLFVLQRFPSTAQVLVNQGGGSFAPRGAVELEHFADRAVIADITSDGMADVIVGDGFGSGFTVLVGDGEGGLRTAKTTHVDYIDIAVADFDTDGNNDLALVSGGEFGSVTVLPGSGDTVFEFGIGTFFHTLVTHPPLALVTGHFNGDDRIDIAVSTKGAELVIFDNRAAFSFEGRLVADGSDSTVGASRPGLLSADIDQDGHDDLLIKDSFQGAAGLRAYLNEGTGLFTSHRDLPVEPTFRAVVVGDMNRDGHADVVGATSQALLSFYRGLGMAELEAPQNLSLAGFRPLALAALPSDDAAGDELVVLSPSRLHVFTRGPDGFESPRQYGLPGLVQRMAQGDFTGDGRTQLAMTDVASRKIYLLAFDRPGEVAVVVERDVTLPPDDLLAADLDSDRVSDLVVLHRGRPELSVLLGPGKPDAPASREVPVGGSARGLTLTDAGGDAIPDLLLATDTTAVVYSGDGLGGFVGGREVPELAGSEILRCVDGDNDGALDVVAARGARVVVMRSFLEADRPALRSMEGHVEIDGLAVGAPVAQEFASIALVGRASGVATVLRGAFHPSGAWIEEYAVATSSLAADFADFSQDGREDLAIADFSGGKIAILAGVDMSDAEMFRRGDANVDGSIDIGDPLFVLNHLFVGNVDLLCPDAADTNDDGARNIADPIGLLNYLFAGGAPPALPGPLACGLDPTNDELPRCSTICR